MNILFISLGCDKNLVDSEVMLGILAKDGHQMVDDETMADVIIINTCCFIHDAKEESIQNILEMADLKKTGRLKALIVTGCLAQRYKEEIIQEIPEVDAVLGTTSYEEIAHVIDGVLSDSPMERGDVRLTMKDVDYLPVTDTHRMVQKAVTSTVLTVLSQRYEEIFGVCRWSICWRKRRIWQTEG